MRSIPHSTSKTASADSTLQGSGRFDAKGKGVIATVAISSQKTRVDISGRNPLRWRRCVKVPL